MSALGLILAAIAVYALAIGSVVMVLTFLDVTSNRAWVATWVGIAFNLYAAYLVLIVAGVTR